MPKTLVIVESPTKAKTISKFLGSSYIVESSYGHVRDLPKSKMGIDIEGGTFSPSYRVTPDKTKQVKKLKELAKKCENNIIFATDEDREGEAISWHLAYILGVKPKEAKRIVFHEITKSAINHALENPRHIDQSLVDAQQARRVLDRLVGYELSPFLWKKVARGLSAGRVQSVAVRLIVDRERQRDAFDPQEYWSLAAEFLPEGTDHALHSSLHSLEGKKVKKLDISSKEAMDVIVNGVKTCQFTIDSIEQKAVKKNPPPPFRTSTLQQQANNKFGYSSKQTMRLAQQLYEGISVHGKDAVGLITYMRTDSTNMSAKFLSEAGAYIKGAYGDAYGLEKPRVYANRTKGAQEAHEAIRPTHPEMTPESIKQYLDPRQYKVYDLIWRRAMATQLASAKLQKTSIDILSTDSKYGFRATGQTVSFDGWLKLYPKATKENMLPEVSKGQATELKELKPDQHFTQPPARYSDATLVKALEEHEIGRPSTYAPTIATIEARKYVMRDDSKRFRPETVAYIVTDLLVEHFNDIVDLDFTAHLEQKLDHVAHGEQQWKPLIKDFYNPFHKNLKKKEEEVSREDVQQVQELGIDPKSGKPVSARIGRFGPYVQLGTKDDEEKPRFASLQEGQLMQTISLDEALVLLSLPRTLGQDEEGTDIKASLGRFGPYIQVGKTYYSIKKDTGLSPYTVSLEEANEVIRLGKEEKAKKQIKFFEKEDIKILRGPYGPYVTDGKKNARIPKDNEDPAALTLEECQKLLAEAKPGRKGRSRKKAGAKKKTAKKKK